MKLAEINQQLKAIKTEKLKPRPAAEIIKEDPFEQFLLWFELALQSASSDPSAMVLATVDEQGYPDTRMVLLKELEYQRFLFFTGYDSKKAKDLRHQKVAALNFYWPNLLYQVRIRGVVEKLDRRQNERYFATRARDSQLGAVAWTQSAVIRGPDELEERIQQQAAKYKGQEIPCPENWGGYALCPFEYEFFQRRQWRRHERLFYRLHGKIWERAWLAP